MTEASPGRKVPAQLGAVRSLPTGAIEPSTTNPRKIPKAAVDIVAKSIAEFGWQQPLVVDSGNVVIVGHTRLLAAKQLGLPTVPVVIADNLTPEQVRAYRIADNRSGDFTSWDFPELAAQLEDLAEDFSDVLALADWQSIVAEMDDPQLPDDDAGTTGSEAPSDEIMDYLAGGHQISVVCDSGETLRRVSAALIDMPGVIDVRNKR